MALVVTCEPGRGVLIGENTMVGIQNVRGKSVRLVIIAPDDVRVERIQLPPDPQGAT